jgi:cbb3-type cytochrome oxidase maturation protein
METVYLLVPLAAVLALGVVAALAWAVRNGQFDDLEGPAARILLEELEAGERGGKRKEAQPSAGAEARADGARGKTFT